MLIRLTLGNTGLVVPGGQDTSKPQKIMISRLIAASDSITRGATARAGGSVIRVDFTVYVDNEGHL